MVLVFIQSMRENGIRSTTLYPNTLLTSTRGAHGVRGPVAGGFLFFK